MHIAVFVPARNEEASVGEVLREIPPEIEGHPVTKIVIDDGSTDQTCAVAAAAGATVVSLGSHQGLGAALRKGLEVSIALGAEYVVQIDADGQYDPADIPALLAPLLAGECDLVLGTRFERLEYPMPWAKRWGNRFMSRWVSFLTGTTITDAQTGFRAYSRRVADLMQLYLRGVYTYTQEMIIHAAFNKLRIAEVPTRFRKRAEGESRLIQNVLTYFWRTLRITLMTYQRYRPLRFFGVVALLVLLFGIGLLVFDNLYSLQGVHLIPSLDLSGDPKTLLTIFLPLGVGFMLLLFGVVLESVRQSRDVMVQSNLQLREHLTRIERKILDDE